MDLTHAQVGSKPEIGNKRLEDNLPALQYSTLIQHQSHPANHIPTLPSTTDTHANLHYPTRLETSHIQPTLLPNPHPSNQEHPEQHTARILPTQTNPSISIDKFYRWYANCFYALLLGVL